MNAIKVGLNEIKSTNNNCKIIYTIDLTSCMAIVMHTPDKTYMMHLESYEKNNMHLTKLIKFLLKNRSVISIDIFKAPYTNYYNLNKIVDMFNDFKIQSYIYDAFINKSNLCGVAYNDENDEYLSVSMDLGKPRFETQNIRKLQK